MSTRTFAFTPKSWAIDECEILVGNDDVDRDVCDGFKRIPDVLEPFLVHSCAKIRCGSWRRSDILSKTSAWSGLQERFCSCWPIVRRDACQMRVKVFLYGWSIVYAYSGSHSFIPKHSSLLMIVRELSQMIRSWSLVSSCLTSISSNLDCFENKNISDGHEGLLAIYRYVFLPTATKESSIFTISISYIPFSRWYSCLEKRQCRKIIFVSNPH